MASTDLPTVNEPFPVFKVAHKYMVYDVSTVTHIRAKHNIPGVLIGQLPQAPQQNIFSGIPLELMPEEARLLCEKGVAYIVDDAKNHKQGFLDRGGLSEEERKAFRESLRRQGQAVAGQVKGRAEERTRVALGRKMAEGNMSDWNDLPEDMLRPASRASNKKKGKKARSGTVTPSEAGSGTVTPVEPANGEVSSMDGSAQTNGKKAQANGATDEEDTLFCSPMNSFPGKPLPEDRSLPSSTVRRREPEPYSITPTTSHPPLTAPPPPSNLDISSPLDLAELDQALPNCHSSIINELPEVPPSYPLYKHMHSKDYFMTPGMRFGCQYTAYPGDPLRFHSHFLANGMDWDEEFDLMELVRGGRLGTGVKKGYLIGGVEKKNGGVAVEDDGDGGGEEKVRTFCVEWGGM